VKPGPFAAAVMAKVSGVVQGLSLVARFVAEDGEPPPAPRQVQASPAAAARRVTDGKTPPVAPAAPARAACPRVRMPGWRCPLADAHAGPCVLEEVRP
jgi:hypothetical protein